MPLLHQGGPADATRATAWSAKAIAQIGIAPLPPKPAGGGGGGYRAYRAYIGLIGFMATFMAARFAATTRQVKAISSAPLPAAKVVRHPAPVADWQDAKRMPIVLPADFRSRRLRLLGISEVNW